MGVDEDCWDHLLGLIEDQRLLPVIGPELTVVQTGTGAQTFTSLIGQRLAGKYELSTSAEINTIAQAVAAILQKHGRDEVGRLYSQINHIIKEFDQEPCEALRDLAAVEDLRIFVSTTPDRLLAKALNEVRFRGRELTRELPFSLKRSTSLTQLEQAEPVSETVVVNLFGRAASTPEYAIHEEDRLEWLHALLPNAARLPEWLAYKLRHQPLLFIGCEIPDWIGRFLLRLSSTERLSNEDKNFFFVGSPNSREPSLSDFFATYCRRRLVQEFDMEPSAFVAELHRRYAKTSRAAPLPPGVTVFDRTTNPVGSDAAPIFISYMREDAAAAQRLHDAIRLLGGNAWLDTQRLMGGDAWEKETLIAIGQTAQLFVAVISARTEREKEGFVFQEWREALGRAPRISSGRFIVPVVIDEDYDGDPTRYPKGWNYFGEWHFSNAPGGEPDAALAALLTAEIASMSRSAP